jgi:hypothetical protein
VREKLKEFYSGGICHIRIDVNKSSSDGKLGADYWVVKQKQTNV